MKTAFVCGPYYAPDKHQKLHNIAVAQDLAMLLWTKGFGVVCPHLNTRLFDLHIPVHDSAYRTFYLQLLHSLHPDIIVTTPGYERSSGAQAELALAYDLNIPLYHFNSQTFKCLPHLPDQPPLEAITESTDN